MKTLIFSYLASVSAIILISLPIVKDVPLDIIPRIGFYFGFPSAIILSMIVIGISHLLGKSNKLSGSNQTAFTTEGQLLSQVEQKVA